MQHDWLLKKLFFIPFYTSQNVVMMHIRLNQLKYKKNSYKVKVFSFDRAKIKVHLLQKEIIMFKFKGSKSRLTCKQIGGTYTYGRLLKWGWGNHIFRKKSWCILTFRK